MEALDKAAGFPLCIFPGILVFGGHSVQCDQKRLQTPGPLHADIEPNKSRVANIF